MKKNIGLYLTFLFILLIAVFAGFIDAPKGSKINLTKIGIHFNKQYPPHLGLDLVGGAYLEYQGDLAGIPAAQQSTAMEAVRSAIERRIFLFGVQEPVVQTSGADRVDIQLPGITDINQAIQVIGQTPFLEFKEEDPTYKPTPDASGNVAIDPNKEYKSTGLTGKDLSSASVQFDPTTGQPEIQLQFNAEGTKLFNEITTRDIGHTVAIFLDGYPLSTPTVQAAITDGTAIITGQFKLQDAKDLASRLNSGALPVPIKLISQQNVGASLGQDSIHSSLIAGLIGLLIIALFMIIYYRFPGVLAVLALIIYTLLSFAIFKIGISIVAVILVGIFFLLAISTSWMFGMLAVLTYFILLFAGNLSPVTLTLAGIAGFILSIGMAVDANVLIFERTKEELRLGKDVSKAVDDGFNRAWLSIRDSNASSLITTWILYMFGTPEIKSFAITLAIGIIISLFTAITVTRTFLRMFLGHNILAHPWLFGGTRKKDLPVPAAATVNNAAMPLSDTDNK